MNLSFYFVFQFALSSDNLQTSTSSKSVDCVSPYIKCVLNITDLPNQIAIGKQCYQKCGSCPYNSMKTDLQPKNCSHIFDCQKQCDKQFNSSDVSKTFYSCRIPQVTCLNDNPSCLMIYEKCSIAVKSLATTTETLNNCTKKCPSICGNNATNHCNTSSAECDKKCLSAFDNSDDGKAQNACQKARRTCENKCTREHNSCRSACDQDNPTLETVEPSYTTCDNIQTSCLSLV